MGGRARVRAQRYTHYCVFLTILPSDAIRGHPSLYSTWYFVWIRRVQCAENKWDEKQRKKIMNKLKMDQK